VSATAASTLTVGTTKLGKVLVDGDGRTLYLDTDDTQNKPSTCTSTCQVEFPPLIASKLPSVAGGLSAAKLSLLKRPDGTEQIAYNGWPLYVHDKDTKAGDVTGQSITGPFFAIDSTGAAITK